ncbi:MAG: MBL fold metallo-hydrolase, partial [Thermoplasmata archaeon]|nr:MBL fold metallo-hydrolase [Thermoplasmata archaeon]
MTSLTLFGGVAQIGGNKIEIKDKRTRLFFDFGEPFGLGEDYYVDWLGPRGIYGLKDYFEFGLIPQIKGVFSKDALKYTTLKYTKPTVDAIFISHCHFDHVSHLRFVDESIPVYLGETTKKIMDAWAETTTFGNFGEHDWHTFKTGDRIKIKNIKVEPIHVDHSIPAAYGFIINTTKGPIVYTGDFRQHGTRPDLTHDFLKRAKQVKPVAMVCEGTRMAPEEDRVIYTEKGVKRESNKILKNSNKLVVTTFYGRDVDRMRTFYEVAKNNRRKFVVSVRTAVLLKKLNEETDIKIPHPLKDKNIKIYFRRKRS